MVLAESGEDAIMACTACRYAANVERAVSAGAFEQMPQESSRPREKRHTPEQKTVEEVTRFLVASRPRRLVKTLIYQTEKGTVAVLVRGDQEVNETKLARALDCHGIDPGRCTERGEDDRRPGGFCRGRRPDHCPSGPTRPFGD